MEILELKNAISKIENSLEWKKTEHNKRDWWNQRQVNRNYTNQSKETTKKKNEEINQNRTSETCKAISNGLVHM